LQFREAFAGHERLLAMVEGPRGCEKRSSSISAITAGAGSRTARTR
jgi:hypothetical protein